MNDVKSHSEVLGEEEVAHGAGVDAVLREIDDVPGERVGDDETEHGGVRQPTRGGEGGDGGVVGADEVICDEEGAGKSESNDGRELPGGSVALLLVKVRGE